MCLIEIGRMGAFRKKVGAFRADRTEKVHDFRAKPKFKKGGFRAAHTRTALIWEYTPRGIEQVSMKEKRSQKDRPVPK